MIETFGTLLRDPAHWGFELLVGFIETLVFDGLLLGLFWPFARKHWRQVVKEKHRAQDCVIAALRLCVKNSSTLTPNTPASKTYSTALRTLELWLATKRVKSASKLNRKKSVPIKRNGRS